MMAQQPQKRHLQQVEQGLDRVRITRLEVEKRLGHPEGALLHHVAAQPCQPAFIRVDEGEAGQKAEIEEEKKQDEQQRGEIRTPASIQFFYGTVLPSLPHRPHDSPIVAQIPQKVWH